jgi:hypothetical protein
MKTKLSVGDRVRRIIDKRDRSRGYREGSISEVYERSKGIDVIPAIFSELYEVQWDDGNTSRGYLSSGLERVG